MNVWSVRDLAERIRVVLETDPQLCGLAVRGEISNFTRSANGHCYFVLKDDQAQISAVMFRAQASRCAFQPGNGMRVIALGRVAIYAPRGQVQFMVSEMRQDGLGNLYQAFLELKARLEKEGLFAPSLKRPLPVFPRRVGLVTSPHGAALHDMVTTLRRRAPWAEVVLSPTLVQGAEAPPQIVAALRRLWRLGGTPDAVDVIIVGRGGGSFEELNAFNDEAVARALRESPVPVVSGVGHETDFTICDLAADERAATPTAAAARATPDRGEMLERLGGLRERLRKALARQWERQKDRFLALERRDWQRLPARLLDLRRQELDETMECLSRAAHLGLERRHHELENVAGRLDALSPLKVLARGYSVCRQVSTRQVVTHVHEANAGDVVEIRVCDGSLHASVLEVSRLPSSVAEAVSLSVPKEEVLA